MNSKEISVTHLHSPKVWKKKSLHIWEVRSLHTCGPCRGTLTGSCLQRKCEPWWVSIETLDIFIVLLLGHLSRLGYCPKFRWPRPFINIRPLVPFLITVTVLVQDLIVPVFQTHLTKGVLQVSNPSLTWIRLFYSSLGWCARVIKICLRRHFEFVLGVKPSNWPELARESLVWTRCFRQIRIPKFQGWLANVRRVRNLDLIESQIILQRIRRSQVKLAWVALPDILLNCLVKSYLVLGPFLLKLSREVARLTCHIGAWVCRRRLKEGWVRVPMAWP